MKAIAKNLIEKILAWAARRIIATEKPIIIGVTGSAGKTSTKSAIGFLLERSLTNYRVVTAAGNLNTEMGLPLVILGEEKVENSFGWVGISLRAVLKALSYQKQSRKLIFVLEYGADHPGDITRLTYIIAPTIAAITLISPAHTLYFGDIEKVAEEKAELVKAVSKDGLVVLNSNDERVKAMKQLTRAKVVLVDSEGINLAKDLAMAIAKHYFKLDQLKSQKILQDWQPPVGRLNLMPGKNGSWLLDDTYNANPASMTLALRELVRLSKVKKARRLVVILGDMLELGKEEAKVHKGIALLAEKVADEVIMLGPRFGRTKIGQWFGTHEEAIKIILSTIEKGDMILVKGSQGMRMEKISAALLSNQLDPKQVLVRQSVYWQHKPYIEP